MNNLDKAREAFLNSWFDADRDGGHWSNGMSAKHADECEAQFNVAFAAAIAAVTPDDIPVVETQIVDGQGNWTKADSELTDATEKRILVDLEDVKSAMLKQEIVVKVWKTAVEDAAVERTKLKDRLYAQSNASDDEVEKLEAKIESIRKALQLEPGIKGVSITAVKDWQTWLDESSELFLSSGDADSRGFGQRLKSFSVDFQNVVRERQAAYDALQPFAKSGTLFKARIHGYNETVYKPAAGEDYFITGDDLRRATSIIHPNFVWITTGKLD